MCATWLWVLCVSDDTRVVIFEFLRDSRFDMTTLEITLRGYRMCICSVLFSPVDKFSVSSATPSRQPAPKMATLVWRDEPQRHPRRHRQRSRPPELTELVHVNEHLGPTLLDLLDWRGRASRMTAPDVYQKPDLAALTRAALRETS